MYQGIDIMKIFIVVLVGLLMNGCAGGFANSPDQPKEAIVDQAGEADAILSCLAGNRKMSRKDFNIAYKKNSANASGAEKGEILRLICLSLGRHASYKQFKAGMELLSRYIKEHPESGPELQGIHVLMQRIDREKINKWVQNNKIMDEKEGLEAENKELQERNEVLEKSLANDRERIKELHQQIEQLKNIESIIKNRER
jgi:hypothetical protein